MQPNQLLSITIPTYNRADFLDRCLELLIESVKKYNIEIFISDNASPDNTCDVVEKHKKNYPLIQHVTNDKNIGWDANFEQALKLPDTEYIWLLGDTYQAPHKTVANVLNAINKKKFDVLVVNAENRVRDVEEMEINDRNDLLSGLGWHMTCLSTLIYHKSVLLQMNQRTCCDLNFSQTGIILDYCSKNTFSLYWMKNDSVLSISLPNIKKKSWQLETFSIWIKSWPRFIFSLPDNFTLESKCKCILDHGFKSQLFNLSGLCKLRSENILNYQKYKKYKELMPLTIKINRFFILLISLLPKGVAKNIPFIIRAFKYPVKKMFKK